MFELQVEDIVLVSVVFFLAGVVKGGIGLGLPTVSIGLMALWLPFGSAMGILVLPAVITNIWQAFFGTALKLIFRRYWDLMIWLFAGAFLGATLISGINVTFLVAFLGFLLIVYAGLSLSGKRFSIPVEKEKKLNPLIGVTTGLVSGATAFFVLPIVPYLQSIELEKEARGLNNKEIEGTKVTDEEMNKDAIIQSFALSILCLAGGMSFGLGLRGALPVSILVPGLLGTVAAIVGMVIGRNIRNKISLNLFRRCILVFLMFLGLVMILRAVI
tara:strand:- start:133 stop:948 length:816 start_codon:yes stop_codon:yes gene_type:complete